MRLPRIDAGTLDLILLTSMGSIEHEDSTAASFTISQAESQALESFPNRSHRGQRTCLQPLVFSGAHHQQWERHPGTHCLLGTPMNLFLPGSCPGSLRREFCSHGAPAMRPHTMCGICTPPSPNRMCSWRKNGAVLQLCFYSSWSWSLAPPSPETALGFLGMP